jgi:hypothetical protein
MRIVLRLVPKNAALFPQVLQAGELERPHPGIFQIGAVAHPGKDDGEALWSRSPQQALIGHNDRRQIGADLGFGPCKGRKEVHHDDCGFATKSNAASNAGPDINLTGLLKQCLVVDLCHPRLLLPFATGAGCHYASESRP